MKNMKHIENSVQNIKEHAKCMLQKGKLLMKKGGKIKILAFSQLYNNIKQYLGRFPGGVDITPFPWPAYTG